MRETTVFSRLAPGQSVLQQKNCKFQSILAAQIGLDMYKCKGNGYKEWGHGSRKESEKYVKSGRNTMKAVHVEHNY